MSGRGIRVKYAQAIPGLYRRMPRPYIDDEMEEICLFLNCG